MHTSDAFSDYMVSYSVNRSINLSPTLGRLHKHREPSSFGPTICLLNRSRDKIEESTAVQEKDESLLSKILLMSLEIERLNEENRKLKMEREERGSNQRSRQTVILKEQIQRLRSSVERSESTRQQLQQKHADQIYELREKLSASEAESRTLSRRLRESEKETEELRLKGRANQSAAERAKMDASRLEMSMHFNSTNIDLQKSIARQKNMEIEGLREKIARCQEIIRDQKFIINGQKEQINKERVRVSESEGRYRVQLQSVRRQLQATQFDNAQQGQQEVSKLQLQIRDWQARVMQAEGELKQKCLIIANQLKNISQAEQRSLELQSKLQDQEFATHSKVMRAEEAVKLAQKERERQTKKLSKELQKYMEEVETLRITVEQYRQNIAEKDMEVQQTTHEMSIKLREKEQIVKKLRRRDKEQQSEAKLNKSLSLDNMGFSTKLRASQVSLEHIVKEVAGLRDSHDRSSRLLGRSFISRESYYAK